MRRIQATWLATMSPDGLFHGGHGELSTSTQTGRPTGSDGLHPCVESNTIGSVHVQGTE